MKVRQDLVFVKSAFDPSGSENWAIHLRRAGDAHLPALLLIHGWGGSSRYFEPLMLRLSDAFHCIAPDMPGFGKSPLPLPAERTPTTDRLARLYSHRGLAQMMQALLDALGVAQCDVLGHSYGSGVAIALAAAAPQRVRRVVLSNFSTFRSEMERRMIIVMHDVAGAVLWLRSLRFAHSDSFARFLGTRFFHRSPNLDTLRAGLEDFWRMHPLAAEWTVRASMGWETPQDLRTLQQPLLLIHSRRDRIMPPRNAEFTAALAPRGQLKWLEDCGHLPMVEMPDQCAALVRDFLGADRASATTPESLTSSAVEEATA